VSIQNKNHKNTLKVISSDRDRTNVLRKYEQNLIAYLVTRIPAWISSDMLTLIGFSGSIIIFLGFILATYIHPSFLLLGVAGFVISWFGDSLDGRIAYYRKKPRKWYGFALDITADWLGIILMGFGFVIYATGPWEMLGFGFVVMYGWEMITTLVRYKITGKYSIDSGMLGPTEVRIILSLIFTLEVLVHDSILYMSVVATSLLFIANIIDSLKLLKLADECDIREKEQSAQQSN
jgi:phosphatidylglycerophosphate synthase